MEADDLENIRMYIEGYLYGEKEYSFLLQTMRSRKLSPSQMAWKEKIAVPRQPT